MKKFKIMRTVTAAITFAGFGLINVITDHVPIYIKFIAMLAILALCGFLLNRNLKNLAKRHAEDDKTSFDPDRIVSVERDAKKDYNMAIMALFILVMTGSPVVVAICALLATALFYAISSENLVDGILNTSDLNLYKVKDYEGNIYTLVTHKEMIDDIKTDMNAKYYDVGNSNLIDHSLS